MATQTTNYNLEKPEATDPFGDFRQSYNSNMDIIDANLGGGGGGGGHTIIDPNGNSLPQENGLQFTGNVSVTDDNVNGRTVVTILGGGGSVNYSTSEQVIGTWIDGRPLYQKTISKNNVNMGNANGVYTSIPHGIADFDFAVDLEMVCPKLNISAKDQLREFANFKADATNVFCAWGNNHYGATADRYWYITIRYTKTTD